MLLDTFLDGEVLDIFVWLELTFLITGVGVARLIFFLETTLKVIFKGVKDLLNGCTEKKKARRKIRQSILMLCWIRYLVLTSKIMTGPCYLYNHVLHLVQSGVINACLSILIQEGNHRHTIDNFLDCKQSQLFIWSCKNKKGRIDKKVI